MTSVHMWGLPFTVQDDELLKLVGVPIVRMTRGTGTAKVDIEDDAVAREVIARLHGTFLRSRKIGCCVAREQRATTYHAG